MVIKECPDFWEKTIGKDGITKCTNKYLVEAETYKIGDNKTEDNFILDYYKDTKNSNQDKCLNGLNTTKPWTEMNNKCKAANI
jgi:hypothetical protein